MLPVRFTARNRLILAKPLVTTEFDITSKDSQKTFSKPTLADRRMPPLISLTDNSIEMMRLATMHNVQNDESLIAQQSPRQKSPKHFSLHLAVWLSAPADEKADHLPFVPIEDLQALANRICNDQGMVCFVEKDGDVISANTSNRQSQLYRFQYKYQDGRQENVSRATAKQMHKLIRNGILETYGDQALR